MSDPNVLVDPRYVVDRVGQRIFERLRLRPRRETAIAESVREPSRMAQQSSHCYAIAVELATRQLPSR
jgi:hypothetical protein